MQIHVNIDQLKQTRQAVRAYSNYQNEKIKVLNTKFQQTQAFWNGVDGAKFECLWAEYRSMFMEKIKSLDNYASYLEYCEQQYQNMQLNLNKKAQRLIK